MGSTPSRSFLVVGFMLLMAFGYLVAGPGVVRSEEAATSLSITSGSATVDVGEQARFQVQLSNGSPAVSNGELTLKLSGNILRAGAEVVDIETNGVRPERVRVDTSDLNNGVATVVWRGDMAVGGQLTVALRAQTGFCTGSDDDLLLEASAGPVGGTPVVMDKATVTVNCQPTLNLADLFLDKKVQLRGEAGVTDDADVLPRQGVSLTLSLLNDSTHPIQALLVDELAPDADSPDRCRFVPQGKPRLAGSIVALPPGSLGSDYPLPYLARVPSGESVEVQMRGYVVGDAGCTLEGAPELYAAAFVSDSVSGVDAAEAAEVAMSSFRSRVIRNLLAQPSKIGNLLTLNLVAPDLGDAPASLNHPGAPMLAYPGIQANFPTVYDVPAGQPVGPRHLNARSLRLGLRASIEKEADLGPNRNIKPVLNVPNLDVHDDALNPATLALQPCTTTVIPLVVTVDQYALDQLKDQGKKAYLNIWIDGNRDGDWGDSAPCGNVPAPEHIVIDQVLNLTASGTTNVVATTTAVPLEAGKEKRPMWMRVSLSDEPSAKPLTSGAVQHGDGRGPAGGFELGETEDFLVFGPGAADDDLRGPYIDVETEFDLADSPGGSDVQAASVVRRKFSARLLLLNQGDSTVNVPNISLSTEPNLGLPTTDSTSGDDDDDDWVIRCLTCVVASEVYGFVSPVSVTVDPSPSIEEVCDGSGDCRLLIKPGQMTPGTGGTILLQWDLPAGFEGPINIDMTHDDWNGKSTGGQINKNYVVPVPPLPLSIVSPGDATVSGEATGSGVMFEVSGVGEPGLQMRLIDIRSQQVLLDNEIIESSGRWSGDVKLPDGTYRLCALYASVKPSPESCTNAVTVVVDSSLVWSPASLELSFVSNTFPSGANMTSTCPVGSSWRPMDASGRSDEEGWILPLDPGCSYELSARFWCAGTLDATLKLGDQSLPITGSGFGGLYKVSFKGTDEELQAGISVACNDKVIDYLGGTQVMHYPHCNGYQSNEPLQSCEFELWEGNGGNDLWRYNQWPGSAYGQQNPQSSDAAGQVAFHVPAGTYALRVTKEGYQPFYTEPLPLLGLFPSRNIVLMPEVDAQSAAAASSTAGIGITDAGFNPPKLTVAAGTLVRWRNLDLGLHSVVAEGSDGWESGALAALQSFSLHFDTPGVYTYYDGKDPLNTGTIEVVPATSGLFLPFITLQ